MNAYNEVEGFTSIQLEYLLLNQFENIIDFSS